MIQPRPGPGCPGAVLEGHSCKEEDAAPLWRLKWADSLQLQCLWYSQGQSLPEWPQAMIEYHGGLGLALSLSLLIFIYLFGGLRKLHHAGFPAVTCGSIVVVVRGCSCPVTCGILVHPPGIKPASSALQSGFLTTGPPGKSPGWPFLSYLGLL